MKKQVTLAAVADYSGIGLHSGKEVTMRLMPGEPDTGIVFIRTDLPGKPEIHARAELVTSTLKATTLSENGAQVLRWSIFWEPSLLWGSITAGLRWMRRNRRSQTEAALYLHS